MNRSFQLCFWAAAAFALIMALIPQPPQIPGEPSDKLQHMLAFFVLTTLGASAFPRLSLLILAIGLGIFGAAIEIGQSFPVINRTADIYDWIADMAAVLIGIAVIVFWRRLRVRG